MLKNLFAKSIKIGGLKYKIILRSDNEMDGDCGKINIKTLEIYINKDMDKDVMVLSLFHEIFHAINMEMNHKEVEFLAQAWFQFIKDNNI